MTRPIDAEQSSGLGAFTSQETDEWATPPEFVRPLATAIGGFDLDPAAGAERSPVADRAYTQADDGLSSPWFGRVWLNPPYSEMGPWLRKAISELNRGDVESIVALVKGDTSTSWYQRYAMRADAIAFVDGRLSFGDGDNSAPFPSHVLVYGDVPGEVFDVLDRRGVVVRTADIITRTEQTELTSDA